jgi:hypothetical protein
MYDFPSKFGEFIITRKSHVAIFFKIKNIVIEYFGLKKLCSNLAVFCRKKRVGDCLVVLVSIDGAHNLHAPHAHCPQV